MRRALALLVLSALLLTGCGPHADLHPLVGEDRQLLAEIGAPSDSLHLDAPTMAAQTLLTALETGDHATAWRHLSRSSQEGLRSCHAPDAPLGPEVLAQVQAELSTRRDGPTLVEYGFGITAPAGAIRFSVHAPGVEATPPPTRAPSHTAVIHALVSPDTSHPITMLLEGMHWKRSFPSSCAAPPRSTLSN